MIEAGNEGQDAAQGQPYVAPLGRVVRANVHGKVVMFLVTQMRDRIQRRHHMQGEFYEPEELEIIKRHFTFGGTFLDVGANVGNHSIFAAKFLHAARVIPLEVNPVAYQTLIANVMLNGLDDIVDLSRLGIGVSDTASETGSITFGDHNIGAGRVSTEGGELRLLPGDEIVGDTPVDFIKIDVEGMEMTVLAGLHDTIVRNRPRMFIEVDNENQEAFLAWVERNGFKIADRYQRYKANENFMLVPMRPARWARIHGTEGAAATEAAE